MRALRFMAVAALAAATVFTGGMASAATCNAADHSGGEWPRYGGELTNSRNQPLESVIDADNVGDLAPAWSYNFQLDGATGSIQSPPVTGGGCVFVGTDTGWVVGLDADSGDKLWRVQLPVGGQVPGIFGLAVEDGVVYGTTADETGPFAFALDAATGTEIWSSVRVPEIGSTVNSSTVLYDGLVLLTAWGDDPDPTAHSGFAIFEASDGALVDTAYVIPEEEWADGYAGGGIWGTTAIDAETGAGYVGTSNPYSKREEHDNTNAIIKVDLDRSSETFGQVIDSYKGTYDNYAPGLYDNAVCQEGPVVPVLGYNATCAQLDIDFGASPSLFRDSDGTLLIGALQKSGIFHAADATTMDGVWTTIVSPPLLLGNASTATVLDGQVVTSANPGLVWALDADSGLPNWTAPTLDAVRYQAMASANGVVYAVDGHGNLLAFDGTSGLPLLNRSVATDAASTGSILGSPSLSIARNTVFAPAGGGLVAYRLPA